MNSIKVATRSWSVQGMLSSVRRTRSCEDRFSVFYLNCCIHTAPVRRSVSTKFENETRLILQLGGQLGVQKPTIGSEVRG